MYFVPRESIYPVEFRKKETKELANNIKRKRSVELIGMKRVGISNFLRFFLYNKRVFKKHFKNDEKTIFVPVDLKDLIERDIYPFWLLTFKRLVDSTVGLSSNKSIGDDINSLFDKAIQTKDHFLTLDSLRQSLVLLIKNKYHPILFFNGFDRLESVITNEFFDNLRGLRDATQKELVYIFTSVRKLSKLNPKAFDENTVSVFSSKMYFKPAVEPDMEIILKTLTKKYNLKLDNNIKNEIFKHCGGHVQYLYLSIIALHEHDDYPHKCKIKPIDMIRADERIQLQSDELFLNLGSNEKDVLLKIHKRRPISEKEKKKAKYLFKTGMVFEKKGKLSIFSPFLSEYLDLRLAKDGHTHERSYLTKKEHALFETLKGCAGEICERDLILEKVWPEYQEIGVSDWAVDRLVARLRKKLEAMNSRYIVKTVRTRGFILVENGD